MKRFLKCIGMTSLIVVGACLNNDDNTMDPGPGPVQTQPPQPLTLSSASPNKVPLEGKVLVTLKGTGFQTGAHVFFGDKPSSQVTVKSMTEMEVLAPENLDAWGLIAIKVVNPDQKVITNDKILTYFAKNINISPGISSIGVLPISPARPDLIAQYAFGAVAADFDQDGQLDIMATGQNIIESNAAAINNCIMVNTKTHCYLGNIFALFSDGFSYRNPIDLPVTLGSQPISLTAADINQDGKLDIALANPGINDYPAKGILAILKFASSIDPMTKINYRSFVPLLDKMSRPIGIPLTYAPTFLIAGQFQSKQLWDLAALEYQPATGVGTNDEKNIIQLETGITNGVPSTETNYQFGGKPNAAVTADFNQDGWDDLLVTDNSGTLSLFSGQNGQAFGSPKTQSIGKTNSALATGDFNQDGRLDVAIADLGGLSVSIFLQNQQGGFDLSSSIPFGDEERLVSITAGDLNGDNISDLVVAFRKKNDEPDTNNVINQVKILVNQGNGTFSTVQVPYKLPPSVRWVQTIPLVPQQPQAVVLFHKNSDRKLDIGIVDPRGVLITLTNFSR